MVKKTTFGDFTISHYFRIIVTLAVSDISKVTSLIFKCFISSLQYFLNISYLSKNLIDIQLLLSHSLLNFFNELSPLQCKKQTLYHDRTSFHDLFPFLLTYCISYIFLFFISLSFSHFHPALHKAPFLEYILQSSQ